MLDLSLLDKYRREYVSTATHLVIPILLTVKPATLLGQG